MLRKSIFHKRRMIEFLQFEKKCIYNTFWNGKVGWEEIYELYCIMKKWKGKFQFEFFVWFRLCMERKRQITVEFRAGQNQLPLHRLAKRTQSYARIQRSIPCSILRRDICTCSRVRICQKYNERNIIFIYIYI